jgi:hypothetical protein
MGSPSSSPARARVTTLTDVSLYSPRHSPELPHARRPSRRSRRACSSTMPTTSSRSGTAEEEQLSLSLSLSLCRCRAVERKLTCGMLIAIVSSPQEDYPGGGHHARSEEGQGVRVQARRAAARRHPPHSRRRERGALCRVQPRSLRRHQGSHRYVGRSFSGKNPSSCAGSCRGVS